MSTELPAFETLLTREHGGVLHLTLNRPAARNAMSPRMVDELGEALAYAEAGGEVRAVVLRGAGGHFCAGGDLKDITAARERGAARGTGGDAERDADADADAHADADADPIADINAAFGEMCVAFAGTGLATIAVLEGTVMAGGLGLACVVDVALAGESAVFRLPETAIGLVPAQIASFLVERVGYSQARRLAVTGGRIDARTALALGLVHELHPDARLDAARDAVLVDILACAPAALAATKALMARTRVTPPDQLVQEAAAAYSRAARGTEGVEGVAAFLGKRKPPWAA
jgi:isohexenylglutaconyl-CoA hydratase